MSEASKSIPENGTTISSIDQRLKTANAVRQVDLHPAIATCLQQFVGGRKVGLLFCTRTGKPLSPTNIVRRHLPVALKELNYVNPCTGTHKAGNHAFRRFRNTYLRNYTECPEGLYKYWMGHAGRDMSDRRAWRALDAAGAIDAENAPTALSCDDFRGGLAWVFSSIVPVPSPCIYLR